MTFLELYKKIGALPMSHTKSAEVAIRLTEEELSKIFADCKDGCATIPVEIQYGGDGNNLYFVKKGKKKC